jgi:hypothetical protein
MEGFVVREAPALTKLLTLTSFTGLLDTLRGKGIRFDKLASTIRYKDKLLTIRDGKAVGPALGVFMEGAVAPFTNRLDLSGTIVPSYTANSMLSKVPVLGELLAGGEGEGIIAARFGIEGLAKDPDVTVNPLSLLTPGFTRNLFDIVKSEDDLDALTEPLPESDDLEQPKEDMSE